MKRRNTVIRLLTAVTIGVFIEYSDNAIATADVTATSKNGLSPQTSTENVTCGPNTCSPTFTDGFAEPTEETVFKEVTPTVPTPGGDDINSTVGTATDSSNGTTQSNNGNNSSENERQPNRPMMPPLPYSHYLNVKKQLRKLSPPILLAVGLFGNSLTIIILIRQARRSHVTSTIVYLLTLAVSDTTILLCGPLNALVEVDLRTRNVASCKMHVYFTYVSSMMSSWTLVAITMERVISVIFPHKVRLGCTPKSAALVVTLVAVGVFALNIPWAVINGEHYNTNIGRGVPGIACGPTTRDYEILRDDYYQWVDLIAVFFLPFLFLIIGNIIIIWRLAKSRAQRAKTSLASKSGKSSGRDTRSLSVLLIALSVGFCLMIGPVSAFQIYYPYRFKEILEMGFNGYLPYEYLMYQQTLVTVVAYMNACLNFLFYIISGSKFRNELKEMIMEIFCCSRIALFRKGSSTSSSFRNKTAATSISSRSPDPAPEEKCASVPERSSAPAPECKSVSAPGEKTASVPEHSPAPAPECNPAPGLREKVPGDSDKASKMDSD